VGDGVVRGSMMAEAGDGMVAKVLSSGMVAEVLPSGMDGVVADRTSGMVGVLSWSRIIYVYDVWAPLH
jgi:hypothetical protein